MINHLKKIHGTLYLPQATDSVELPFKVSPINEPYLYTETNCYVDTFDSLDQSVKITVSNVGGGRLFVDGIRIQPAQSRWVRRAEGSEPVSLTSMSDPVVIELKLNLKELPNSSDVNIAELNLISNSKRKTFSKVLLRVRLPENQDANLTVPEIIKFGEITAWKVSITDRREDGAAHSVDFLLIGNFTHTPPTGIKINQIDDFFFDAKILLPKGEARYTLDLRNPGAVKPQMILSSRETNPTSIQQTISIANVHLHKFSGPVTTSDMEWLVSATQINVPGFRTVNLSLLVNVEKLKPGRNFGELVISDKKIHVWSWLKIVNETPLTLDRDQSNIQYEEECPEQEKPLQIEVVSTDAPYQSIMIFEDLDFLFPSTANDRTGYLMGDFNQWTPRTLFLEKGDNGFGTTLSISEGTYLYRAEIDGEMRLDPARLYEIVCCSHGLASRIQVDRPEQKITLRNRLKQRIKLKLQSPTEWMRSEPEIIVLPANGEKEITAVFQPEFLKPGLNLGWIEIETEEEPKRRHREPILVMGMTNGIVPVRRDPELAFPNVEQGKSDSVPFTLEVFGKGELKGEIQPSTVLHFTEGDLCVQNTSEFEAMEIAPHVEVLSEKPSNAYRKQIHASLITDCYLANRRLLPFVAKYDMVHLISDPPALYFPKVYLFDGPYSADITIKRSDGKGSVECIVEVPEKLTQKAFLKVKSHSEGNRTGRCGFILNPQAVPDAGRFTGRLKIKDKKSGMSLPIQFAADIVGSQAKIDIQTQRQRLNLSPNGLLLVITNVGETELRIFEMRFKHLRFYLTPSLTSQQRTLLPGESIEREIKAKDTFNLFGKTTVRDTLIVRLNDSQFHNGLFEKEIIV